MADQRFPKSARLLNSAEFQRVFAGSAFAADDVLVIKGTANQTNQTRLGLSIGKKVGNAVVRNRWKRLIREAFRCQRAELPTGLDLVVRPKKGATCDYANIHRSIAGLVARVSKKVSKGLEHQNQEKRN
jgi:ribonuclease P protein component